MAGRPTAAVVSVALPKAGTTDSAEELHLGLQELADEFDVSLAGGDTNAWNGPLVVSVTVLGEPADNGPVLRNGARPGDWIMVTGDFGGSLDGKHLTFQPRVREALQLLDTVPLHAMIDVSDGLAGDLSHILEESRVGAILYEQAIPISEAVQRVNDDHTPLEHALRDGEDFELLFTVTPRDGQKLLDAPPFDVPVSHIGEILPGGGCQLQDPDGAHRPLPAMGWEHAF